MKKLFFIIACTFSLMVANDTTEKPQQKPEWFVEFKNIERQWFWSESDQWVALFATLPVDVQNNILLDTKRKDRTVC